MQLVHAFRDGGWFMWVVVATAVVAMVVAVTALALAMLNQTRQPALAVGMFALVFGILVPVTGGVGYALSMRQAFAAVAYADPSMRAPMLARGISEATNLIVFGLVCGAIPFLLASLAVIRAAMRPKSHAPAM